jgi:hypothetical protein
MPNAVEKYSVAGIGLELALGKSIRPGYIRVATTGEVPAGDPKTAAAVTSGTFMTSLPIKTVTTFVGH